MNLSSQTSKLAEIVFLPSCKLHVGAACVGGWPPAEEKYGMCAQYSTLTWNRNWKWNCSLATTPWFNTWILSTICCGDWVYLQNVNQRVIRQWFKLISQRGVRVKSENFPFLHGAHRGSFIVLNILCVFQPHHWWGGATCSRYTELHHLPRLAIIKCNIFRDHAEVIWKKV